MKWVVSQWNGWAYMCCYGPFASREEATVWRIDREIKERSSGSYDVEEMRPGWQPIAVK